MGEGGVLMLVRNETREQKVFIFQVLFFYHFWNLKGYCTRCFHDYNKVRNVKSLRNAEESSSV